MRLRMDVLDADGAVLRSVTEGALTQTLGRAGVAWIPNRQSGEALLSVVDSESGERLAVGWLTDDRAEVMR